MKWLEIIEIRTAGLLKEELQCALSDLIEEMSQEPEYPVIRVYKSYTVGNDYSIHLAHAKDRPNAAGSAMGVHVADSLKNYGFVHHHVWSELRKMKPGQ